MRNFKKVLSLVLCMAMMLSIMVVGAGAAFKDQEKIVNTEAVDMCSALNIINGYTDGSFKPEGTITRAEACKMICIALNGGKDPVLGTNATPTFTDIKGHWAEKYIEYCVSEGIVAGIGGGKFNPNGNVTGSQFAKMLLIALGYSADHEKFLGNAWEVNVNVKASQKDLYNELSTMDPSVALIRDNAAQMVWNALNAEEVNYTYKLSTDANGNLISEAVVYDIGETMLADKYDTMDTEGTTGVLAGVTYNSTKENWTYDLVKVDGTAVDSFTSKVDYTALLGQEVTFVVKDNTAEDVYGAYATKDNQVVEAQVNDIESVSATEIKIDGTKYKLASTKYAITDGDFATGSLVAKDTVSFNTFKLIDIDGDDKYEGAVITTVAPSKVTYASASEVITGGTTYKAEDHNIADGIAKDDYVTVIYNIADDCYDITEVKAVSGKVDGVKIINGADCARVNGEWYIKNGETLSVDSEYTFYAVNGVVIAGSVDASSADIANLIMVLDTDTYMKNTEAMVLYANGKTATVTVDKDGVSAVIGKMYTYTETDNGYKLKAAATIGSDYTWTNGSTADIAAVSDKLKINNTSVADDAIIYVLTSDGGKTITGKQFKNLSATLLDTSEAMSNVASNKLWDNDLGSYTSEVKGLNRITYAGIFFNGKAEDLGVTNGNELYAYVTSDSYTVGSNYTTYQIWNGTENLTVIDKSANSVAVGDILTYDAIDGDYITGVSKATLGTPSTAGNDGPAYVAGFEGDYVYLDGTTNKYKITSDTKYLYVDSNADEAEDMGKASGEMVLADKFGGIYRDNVIVLVNTSGELELVVVDVKNDMTTAAATLTASIADIWLYATETLNVTSGIKAGDAIEVTITATNDGMTAKTVALANAKTADGAATVAVPALAKGATYTFTVFADGNGNVAITEAVVN